jgi:SAM-dependent methyltransferase
MGLWNRIGRKCRRWVNRDIYRKLSEGLAVETSAPEVVGAGDYDGIGRTELDLLRAEGLRPEHTLLDLGCGNGRLAVHAIPYLRDGAYIGVDISRRLLAQARERVARTAAEGRCRVSWQVAAGSCRLDQPSQAADMICAFSVFTHVEHEDAYRYLVEARRVVRPDGRFVFSCLPLELALAKDFLREQAPLEFDGRWSRVRNVVTSRDLMEGLAEMAGWQVVRWYAGDEATIPTAGGDRCATLGQSSCVLSPATPASVAQPVATHHSTSR